MFFQRDKSHSTETTRFESDVLISKSHQKFSQANESLKQMQNALRQEKVNLIRQISSTPRHLANVPESRMEEAPPSSPKNLTTSEDLQTSLKKQLGIDEKSQDSRSPHRFFDWEQDSKGNGAADPSNFLTIEQ